MKQLHAVTMAMLAALVLNVTPNRAAADDCSTRHVVDAARIQDRIDRQSDLEADNREAVQTMLQRPEVRALAGQAGLDINRASSAAAILSGAELATMAAQANEINAGIGGDSVVLTTTAIIIILLILILLLN